MPLFAKELAYNKRRDHLLNRFFRVSFGLACFLLGFLSTTLSFKQLKRLLRLYRNVTMVLTFKTHN